MEPFTSVWMPPMRPMNRLVAGTTATSGVPSWTTDSVPTSSMASMTASATSVRASSQVMRSHWPEPRSPTRRMGCRRRSAASICWDQLLPFWHPRGFMSGTPGSNCGKVPATSSRRILPSFT